MLMTCSECEGQVSDKALSCPHCGCPIKTDKPARIRRSSRRMRLPNGFGQISEIKNRNLRNPFRAMVTVGKTPEGRPICKLLEPVAYFPTYNDAYIALVKYNESPQEASKTITMSTLYDQWLPEYSKSVSNSRIRVVKAAWSYCSCIYEIPVNEIKVLNIKECVEGSSDGDESRSQRFMPNIRLTLCQLLDYAMQNELTDHNCARTYQIPKFVTKCISDPEKEHIPFTDDEFERLWRNVNIISGVDLILIQSYSGWRPTELCTLRTADVNINDWTFKGGIKTDAGKNRIVPIHPKIKEIVKKHYEAAISNNSEYLFLYIGKKGITALTYRAYQNLFKKVVTNLSLNEDHRPHDSRKHFVTMAKKYNVDEYAIKYLIGHAISDITERVYTKRDVEWLRKEIEKIK